LTTPFYHYCPYNRLKQLSGILEKDVIGVLVRRENADGFDILTEAIYCGRFTKQTLY